LQRALRIIADGCRRHRHRPIREPQRTLGQKLRGPFAYFGITGNGEALRCFRDGVTRLWRKWLSRRSRGAPFSWDRFTLLLARYPLPAAVVVHSVYRQVANP
jgi:hypothetical protein